MIPKIMSLDIRWNGHTWIYDDPAHGVYAEPFVSGADKIISVLLRESKIYRPTLMGARLLFSASPFGGSTLTLEHVGSSGGGESYWWHEQKLRGWFCSHFHDYFKGAPKFLYAAAQKMETA